MIQSYLLYCGAFLKLECEPSAYFCVLSIQSFFPRLSFYVNIWYVNYQSVICERSVYFCVQRSPLLHMWKAIVSEPKLEERIPAAPIFLPEGPWKEVTFLCLGILYYSDCRECVFVHYINVYQWQDNLLRQK